MHEPPIPGSRHQHVRDLLAIEVAPFDQRRSRPELEQPVSGARHLLWTGHREAGEEGGLREIRCHQSGQREEAVPDQGLGIALDEPVARRGHHHRIEHVGRPVVARDGAGRGGHQLFRRQHAALDRVRRQVLGQRRELRLHDREGDGLHGAHALCILCCHRGNHGSPIDPVSLERLEVGLDAGAASGVGARDSEGDRNRWHTRSTR